MPSAAAARSAASRPSPAAGHSCATPRRRSRTAPPALSPSERDEGEPLTPEAIALAAEDGDALAISLIQRSARVVGESIAALVNMFNPGIIVIGGAVVGAGEVFLAEVRQRVYELSLPLATRDLSDRAVGRTTCASRCAAAPRWCASSCST